MSGNTTGGTLTAASGVAYTGTIGTDFTLSRATGSATGTMVVSYETLRTDGLSGKRLVLTATLGSGTTTERWFLQLGGGGLSGMGIGASDLGTTKWFWEVDVDIASATCLNHLVAYVSIQNGSNTIGTHSGGASVFDAGSRLIQPTNDVFAWPTIGNKILLRTPTFTMPANATGIAPYLRFGWDASGGAGTATGVIKVNNMSFRRVL
jgi:hypothetical protein